MKARPIFGHILFWCILMLTYAVSEWGYRDNFQEAILFEFLFLPVRILAVYINWFVLIPRLLYKNHILKYLLLLTILLFALTILQRYFVLYWGYPVFFPQWMTRPPEPLLFPRIVQTLVVIASPVAFSTGIKLFLNWMEQKNKTKQLEIEKREAELKYLKAQINPHFLFNILNNLYGLSLEHSKKVPSLILKLSELLSYSLYESAAEQTSISKELKLINDFIALEKERYEKRLNIKWKIDKNIDEDMQIAPLLFMPLVENAFKHGVKEAIESSNISLSLSIKNGWLVFEVHNSLPDILPENNTKGIGLKNLKRRLELLCPGRYSLEASKNIDQYTAVLKLKYDG